MKLLINQQIPQDLQQKTISDLLSDPASKQSIVVLVHEENSSENIQHVIHNNKASIRTVTLALENIKNGYQFNDQMAEKKIKSLEEAISTLQKTVSEHNSILLGP